MVAVERHISGNSKMNFIWDEEQLTRLKEYQFLSITLGVKKMLKLKTPEKECHEEPIKFQDCLNDFVEFKLGCNLPWTRRKTGTFSKIR